MVEDKFSVPASPALSKSEFAHTSSSKNALERLPLPQFDGQKINYLRFKKEFSNHVDYPTDKQRMLALKTKCLTKSTD